MRQRGFTLIEVIVAVAIVITVVAMAFGMTTGTRPMAMRSSVTQFDAAVACGRAIAATSGNGATLVFTPRQPYGFTIAIYSGRPTAPDALHEAGIAPILADGAVAEATLGAPPFALFLDSAGHATMARSPNGTPALGTQPGCPQGGRWVLSFSDSRTSRSPEERILVCPLAVGGSPG